MPTTAKSVEDIDREMQALRDQRAATVAAERDEREKSEFAAILSYWADRLDKDPQDTQALRAKADLLDAINGKQGEAGVTVEAMTAVLNAKDGES